MQFNESGLPDNDTLRQAFDFSYTNIMEQSDVLVEGFVQQIEIIRAQQMMAIDRAIENEEDYVKREELKMQKDALEMMLKQLIDSAPEKIATELEEVFSSQSVNAAREIAFHSENPSTDNIAAALLVSCIKSARDFQKISKTFGKQVATIASEVADITAHPQNRIPRLKKASKEARSVYLAMGIGSIGYICDKVSAMENDVQPGNEIMTEIELPDNHEENMFQDIKTLWGTDKTLDTRIVDAFNRMTLATNSDSRISIDKKGNPVLSKGGDNDGGGKNTKKPIGPRPGEIF